MALKPNPRRDALRAKILDIAEENIASGGIVALRARDLAAEAGCALGAIYNVFSDLGEISVEINRRTLALLEQELTTAVGRIREEDAAEVLITLAQAYAKFAREHAPRWRTLYMVGLPDNGDAPGFHDALEPVIGLFAAPLATLYPLQTRRTIDRNARSLFAAVHGLVALGLQSRTNALAERDVDRAIANVVNALTSDRAHLD